MPACVRSFSQGPIFAAACLIAQEGLLFGRVARRQTRKFRGPIAFPDEGGDGVGPGEGFPTAASLSRRRRVQAAKHIREMRFDRLVAITRFLVQGGPVEHLELQSFGLEDTLRLEVLNDPARVTS